ncbi:LuxR family transcriptional regulator [Polaribacter reichenbachii]|uniref:LuxR family transcriptional regulator n=1 Tax=Polaribacter reichenbachii TaxID=996801 RepID=A0A1B8TRC2_9FLAO|nr:AAA family ATPase [Polaribacter reichenbachii]APZ47797.1 LuxR family transcriptional regulator [Polaribacter reichenbachii]AUC18432.1 LuxR family transcriptional regulator [Polaribacter reichenbachii]OBY62217.1 LuxR family transcriptional regulator [Polaribacter reichenbachii]
MFSEKIDLIKKDIDIHKQKFNSNNFEVGCLIIKEANIWIEQAKNRPIPNMLFSEFWYENEVCILFSDTNLGKSVLAVQIANSISKGIPISGFKLEGGSKKVLYLDFELSDKQFENRCSEKYQNHYQFNSNFLRAEFKADIEIPKTFNSVEEYLCDNLTVIINTVKPSVLIVDNLTYLSQEHEKAKEALFLMKALKKLSKEFQISILVLSHTPKRDESKPITKNDLAGSKMLMNFCDSCFAIGGSNQEPSLRYIKQLKQRNTEHLYHTENVILCSLDKKSNFLEFHFEDFDTEKNHLQSNSILNSEEKDEKIRLLVSENLPNTHIATRLNLSEGAIRKRRKKLGI